MSNYSVLAGDSSYDVDYVEGPSPNDEYPENEFQAVFGPLNLPRVYGKNLTAFEVASSGLIAFTVDDVHTVNLGRDKETSNLTYLSTVPDESLKISLGDSNASIFMDAENSNVTITASNQIFLNAPNGVNFESGSNMELNPDGELILSSGDGANITLTPEGDIVMSSSNDTTLYSSNDMTLFAENNIDISASNDIRLNAGDNVWIELDYDNHALLAFANSNVHVTASNDLDLVSRSSMAFNAAESNVTFTLDSSGNDARLFANNDVNVTANNDFEVVSTSNASIRAADSNVTFTLDASANDAKLFANNDVTITSGRTTDIDASSNVAISGTDSVVIETTDKAVFEGAGSVTLQRGSGGDAMVSLSNDNTYKARADKFVYDTIESGAFNFYFDSDKVLSVLKDRLVLNGNLDVQGTINSITATETQLEIQDKTIRLAAPGDDDTEINDGDDNDKAGIIVTGYPEGVDSNLEEIQDKYQKSLKWHYNQEGIDGMLTRDGIDTEAYWELRGGSFKLAAYKDDGTDVAYGLRINENEELEFVKHWTDSNDNTFAKRIARFGRTSTL